MTTSTTTQSEFDRSNVFTSIRRTLIPVLVGVILAALTTVGLDVDPDALTTVLTGIYTSAYYLLARWLEKRFPFIGKILLGSDSEPLYLERPKNEEEG